MDERPTRYPLDDLLSTAQVAEMAGVSIGYISRLCRQGRLDAFRFGERGVWMVFGDSARWWMASDRRRGRPPGGSRAKADQLELDIEK